MKKVVFVGISNKCDKSAFDCSTASGKIIEHIIKHLSCACEKINYVSYAPTDLSGKLRYPTKEELHDSYQSFICHVKTLKPDLLVVCGNLVFKELKRHDFSFCKILRIYHPSYIWVYKRSELDHYYEETLDQIKKIILDTEK